MIISELIKILERAEDDNGDLEVWFSIEDENGTFLQSQFWEHDTSWGKLFAWSSMDIKVKGDKLIFCQYPPFKNQEKPIQPEPGSLIYDERNRAVQRHVESFYSDATAIHKTFSKGENNE